MQRRPLITGPQIPTLVPSRVRRYARARVATRKLPFGVLCDGRRLECCAREWQRRYARRRRQCRSSCCCRCSRRSWRVGGCRRARAAFERPARQSASGFGPQLGRARVAAVQRAGLLAARTRARVRACVTQRWPATDRPTGCVRPNVLHKAQVRASRCVRVNVSQ